MTLPTDPKTSFSLDEQNEVKLTAVKITKVLDNLTDNLSEQTRNDISQVRINALAIADKVNNKTKNETILTNQFSNFINNFFPKVLLPIGITAALLVTFSLNYFTQKNIPEIPLAMTTVDMPIEDLDLLENLEFITWLAEHDQNI